MSDDSIITLSKKQKRALTTYQCFSIIKYFYDLSYYKDIQEFIIEIKQIKGDNKECKIFERIENIFRNKEYYLLEDVISSQIERLGSKSPRIGFYKLYKEIEKFIKNGCYKIVLDKIEKLNTNMKKLFIEKTNIVYKIHDMTKNIEFIIKFYQVLFNINSNPIDNISNGEIHILPAIRFCIRNNISLPQDVKKIIVWNCMEKNNYSSQDDEKYISDLEKIYLNCR